MTKRLDSRSTCDNERPLLGPPSALRAGRVDHGQASYSCSYLKDQRSSRWTNNKGRCLRVSGAVIYKQTEKNLALSSELPLFPELETNQVNDSIRCGLEVKIVEPKDSTHTVQDQLLFPMKLSVRVPRSSELLRVQRSEPHFLQL